MDTETRARWQELCHQAAVEQDPAKMLVLVKEINDLIEGKLRRLNGVSVSTQGIDN